MSSDVFTSNPVNNVRTLICDKKPCVNIVEKKDFLARAAIIFSTYSDILSKTLGAYGSPTIISNHPYKEVTKDGYTVARNIEFDIEESSELDKIIGGLIMDICSRLNYAVGDGTTTAIVATDSIFSQLYSEKKVINMKSNNGIRPKDLLDKFNEVKSEIVAILEGLAEPVTEDNMVDIIRKIVTISSNGDENLINSITSAYETIGFPAIICEKSDNHKTYCEIVDGYRAKAMLGDKIYVNSDNQTAEYKNADVIIFERKVTSAIYNKIIKPINNVSRACGRKLICMAPYFDEVTLSGEIRREIQTEFNQTGSVNLVICPYFNTTKVARQQIADLAIILGTVMIDRALEEQLLEASDRLEGNFIDCINCFDRGIDGILIATDNSNPNLCKCAEGWVNEDRKKDTILTIGFADEASIGMKQSIFKSTHYNKSLYDVALKDAKFALDAAIEKYKELGTYSREVYDCQERYCSLKMKLATLYVGGESEMSLNMNRDAADDAIRAAESAYQFGYVKGCNLSITTTINKMLEEVSEEDDPVKYALLKIIGCGFFNVHVHVMENAFPNSQRFKVSDIVVSSSKIANILIEYGVKIPESELKRIMTNTLQTFKLFDFNNDTELDVPILIAMMSICDNRVFDLTSMSFSDDVINSVKTDIEVLSASSELLSILTVGNQVVLAAWNHKKYN